MRQSELMGVSERHGWRLLAAHLRSYINAPPVIPFTLDPVPMRIRAPKPKEPLAGDTIWYEDPIRKGIHSKMVREGMEKAKLDGKHIGRPRVTGRDGFNESFNEIVPRLNAGTLSRRRAAKELGVGYATLKRLLDRQNIPKD